MASISEVGQQEPIDVLEVDGRYWGFSGCESLCSSALTCSPRKFSSCACLTPLPVVYFSSLRMPA